MFRKILCHLQSARLCLSTQRAKQFKSKQPCSIDPPHTLFYFVVKNMPFHSDDFYSKLSSKTCVNREAWLHSIALEAPWGLRMGCSTITRRGLIGRIGLDKRNEGGFKKKSFKTRTQPSAFVVMSIKAWRIPVGSLFQMAVLHMGFIFHQDRQSARPIGPQPRLLFCLPAWFPAFQKSSEITFISPEKCG